MLKPLLPIPQNAVAFGNRVLATGPPGKSLSPSLLSLLGPVFISAGTSASFPIFLSVTLPSLRLFSSLSPHSIHIFLLHPPPLLHPSVTGGLCSVPHFPPPSTRTLPLSSGLRRARGVSFPPSRSHFRFQPPGVSRASSSGVPFPTALIGNKSCQSQRAGQLQVVIGPVTYYDL